MSEPTEWLRARGVGRERIAAYLADYLTGLGYVVERQETEEPARSVVSGELKRMNPAVPSAMHKLRLAFVPTSGGAAGSWEDPTEVPSGEAIAVDRFLRELLLHLERTVRTESHGTAKVQTAPGARLPWQPATAPLATTGAAARTVINRP
jgi:hypothetical protein